MSPKAKLALVTIAVVAVAVGLWLGRCGTHAPDAVVDAGAVAVAPPPVVDAGAVVAAPTVVDAGQKVVEVVDAGEHEMPIVAPKSNAHPHAIAKAEPKHEEPKHEEPKIEAPKVADKPADAVDAGPPPVVDAGVVDAGVVTHITRKDLEPEAMPSAPITIAYTDQLASLLKLTQVRVFVDGKRVAEEKNDNGIDLTKTKQLYAGDVFPGTHQVRVESVYFGKSNGLFSYMEGYRFRVPQMAVVVIPAGKHLKVDAIAYDKGALERWEKRPAMKLDVALE